MKSILTVLSVSLCLWSPLISLSQSNNFFDSKPNIRSNAQYGTDICTDPFGNYIVTGYSKDDQSLPSDIITVKYDATGKEVWSKLFQGPGHQIDKPVAIESDSQGNIYVACSTQRRDSSNIVVLKYNSLGELIWSEYFGKLGTNTYPVNLAIDSVGNIYIGGNQSKFQSALGILLKYTSEGELLWSKSYKNQAFVATDFGMDSKGSIYLLGSDVKLNSTTPCLSTVKFDKSGNRLWTKEYTSPNYYGIGSSKLSIKNDRIYSAGYLSGYGYDAVCYNLIGDEIWSNSEKFTSDCSLIAASASDQNELVLTGSTTDTLTKLVTIKFTENGTKQWRKNYSPGVSKMISPSDVQFDSLGNIFVTGKSFNGNNFDFLLVKYDQNGTEIFNKRIGINPAGSEQAATIAPISSGKICITGSMDVGYNSDFLTILFTTEGDTIWKVRKSGQRHGDDNCIGIVSDQNGNYFVAGTSVSIGYDYNYLVLKYDVDGNLLWSQTYGTAQNQDNLYAVASDHSGNAIVTGVSGGKTTTVKFASNGTQIWVKSLTAGQDNRVYKVVIDSLNNIYCAGTAFTGSQNNTDLFVVKYDSSGNQLWLKLISKSSTNNEQFANITLDNLGNIYVGGSTYKSNWNYMVVKLDSSGNQIWLKEYTDGSEMSVFTGDKNGNCYLSGTGKGTGITGFTILIDSMGEIGWSNSLTISPFDIKIDHDNNLYICGQSGTGAVRNFTVLKYDSLGAQQWNDQYNADGQSNDIANRLFFDSQGKIWVSGYTSSISNSSFLLSRYSSSGQRLFFQKSEMKEIHSQYSGFLAELNSKIIYTGTVRHPERGDNDIYSGDLMICISSGFQLLNGCQPVEYNNTVYHKSGLYYDTIPNLAGCDSIIEIQVDLFSPNLNVSQNKDSLYADGIAKSYQWFDCENGMSEISGATNRKFIGTKGHSYAVRLTSDSCTLISECTTFIGGTGIKSIKANIAAISIYPNPAKTGFTVQDIPESGTLRLIDNFGKLSAEYLITAGTSTHSVQELSVGLYQLIFTSEQRQISIGKLVKLD